MSFLTDENGARTVLFAIDMAQVTLNSVLFDDLKEALEKRGLEHITESELHTLLLAMKAIMYNKLDELRENSNV